MPSAPKPLTGRCLCGNVTYRADAEPLVQAVCHCTDCQRQTGNPFSVVVAVPRASFHVEGDTLASFTTTGEDHGAPSERNFCSACGSPLFTLAAARGLVIIKAGSLDDASWLEPSLEVWTRSELPWTPSFAGTTRLERGPG
jgi:hypothetical protein